MNYPKKEAHIVVYFPQQRYSTGGSMLRVWGRGTGSSLPVAIQRAFKDAMKDPQIFHKSPTLIYASIGVDGFEPQELPGQTTIQS